MENYSAIAQTSWIFIQITGMYEGIIIFYQIQLLNLLLSILLKNKNKNKFFYIKYGYKKNVFHKIACIDIFPYVLFNPLCPNGILNGLEKTCYKIHLRRRLTVKQFTMSYRGLILSYAKKQHSSYKVKISLHG